MLLVNTMHVFLSVFNRKQQNHTEGLKIPFSWLCSDSELPSNSQVKHPAVLTPFMLVSCVLQLLQERSNSVFLGRLNLQHISLSLTLFLQWPIKEFNIKGHPRSSISLPVIWRGNSKNFKDTTPIRIGNQIIARHPSSKDVWEDSMEFPWKSLQKAVKYQSPIPCHSKPCPRHHMWDERTSCRLQIQPWKHAQRGHSIKQTFI